VNAAAGFFAFSAYLVAVEAAPTGGPDHPAADAGTAAPAPGAQKGRAAVAAAWSGQRVPSSGGAQAIGTCSCGCLQGGAELVPTGPGYEVLHLGRNRRYGHPELVAYIRRLGAAARKARLGLLVVGDMSQPRGGPTPSGHRSHQTGLDVDVGYAPPAGVSAGHLSAADRERVFPPAAVDLATHKPTPVWGPKTIDLIARAAADPAVDRIFVNPAIKRMLCEGATAKAPWQGRVRPWWGHHDHFHVRLRCPAGSPLCVPQETPRDDGCGPGLRWWFSADAEATRTKKKDADAAAAPAFTLPAACEAMLSPSPVAATAPGAR
jgi:penicillin-insensitive murein endopeptidase